MTETPTQGTIRSIVMRDMDSQGDPASTERLLNEMGHEVHPTDSPSEAMDFLRSDRTDLLVVDVAEAAEERRFVNELFDKLPASHLPRQIAIFSDKANDALHELRHRLSPLRVHVFLKPLHLHGLLTVLRNLESDAVVH